ncbi:WD40 repeat-like protein [Armillaria gallica]|uniref:WD40 repeat-like protein n=1 Tax=Armillaria gallica TaxID=47427 RepID=A0A2H3ENK3_ARMGA|nr:WD40 repeat-like protein [Armillaria gallica]
MTPRLLNTSTVNARQRSTVGNSAIGRSRMDFATLGRAPLRLGMGSRRITSRDLEIVEATDELLLSEVPEPEGVASNVSLLRGFNATIPSAEQSRTRRKQMRNVDAPHLGLKKLGMHARGMLADDDDGQSLTSEDDVVMVPRADTNRKTKRRKGRESLSASKILGKEELSRQKKEILRDKENINVRRSLINGEMAEITNKIQALDNIRNKLEQDLLKLHEDELELDDELVGVRERIEFEQESSRTPKKNSQPMHPPQSSRRRKGPAFLPSEHDELPPGVAFMTLESHTTPITALDFSEPYGTLVSASQDDPQPLVWDLFSGTEIGRLRGHTGAVRCLQVEDHVCLSGSDDSTVRLWDLRRVESDDSDGWGDEGEIVSLSDTHRGEREWRRTFAKTKWNSERVLEGHTKVVTALYFEDDCLVTGASDKTLRQWDLTTGQCVMTMDILWAMSHSLTSVPGSLPNGFSSGAAAPIASFAVPTPPFSDGS